MKQKPKARTNDLVIQNAENEILIYDISDNKGFCLNETSGAIWQLCDGELSIEQIANKLTTQMNTFVSEDFVLLGITQLTKDGLLETKTDTPNSNLSRRKLVKKVGFASLVALPLISSVVAPKAVAAQSCVAAIGFVPGTGSPNTSQANPLACQTHCNNLTPDGSASCCSNTGLVAWSFTIATGVCECLGYQCN